MLRYNREKAVEYAYKWAYGRNPKYLNFEGIGGDCTNFISQILYAGSRVMNYTPIYGWYYITASDRTASWTGVEYLYNFLVNNTLAGPFAEETDVEAMMPGDIIQISFEKDIFQHSLAVVKSGSPATLNNIFIATHSIDRYNYRLTNYNFDKIRFLHIPGVY